MINYYKILGLENGASQEEIQNAYERLSKELNPSNNDNQEFFKEEYKKIQEAYKELRNSSILTTKKGVQKPKRKPLNPSPENTKDSFQACQTGAREGEWKAGRGQAGRLKIHISKTTIERIPCAMRDEAGPTTLPNGRY